MRRRKYRDERHSRRNRLWLLRELEDSGVRLSGRPSPRPRDEEPIAVTITGPRPQPADALARFFPFPQFVERSERPSP